MINLIDALKVMRRYHRRVGRYPDLINPRTFTEKVQRAKLTWRSPRMVQLADKVEVKRIVAETLGAEWVTPTLYAAPQLPPLTERNWPVPFVIKANHFSGGNIFVRSQADLDWDQIESTLDGWLGFQYGGDKGEWVYTQIPRQILVEPFIGEMALPIDYKLYVFGERYAFTAVTWDRASGRMLRATFDRDWTRLPFVLGDTGEYTGPHPPTRPSTHNEMIEAAEVMARGFPFARIDFYEIAGRPRFGEVTFYPLSGTFRMPRKYDMAVGALWPRGGPV